jgi:peptidoglycan/LPS O-acetylase OafA/YrhL
MIMEKTTLNECTEIEGVIYCPPDLFDQTIILTIGSVALFFGGLAFVFLTLYRQKRGFGNETNRALGIVLFLPVLFFTIGYKEFPGEAIAALLGTLAGYIFSPGTTNNKDS